MGIRTLNSNDTSALEAFLKEHADTSMFLRSNLRRAGILYQNKPFQGNYIASFNASEEINGVLAHYWNGNVMMQSPDLAVLTQLVAEFKSRVTHKIVGILGEESQAEVVINQLDLADAEYAVNYPDELYSLTLDELIKPANTNNPDYKMIAAKDCDSQLLFDWLKAYHIEALGADAGSLTLNEVIWDEVNSIKAGIDRFVLEVDGKPVSLCGFNATLPDIVQIGSVWTPMEFRNRGYARTLLALSLITSQQIGVTRALLFTNDRAAIRSYESLGFKKIGYYRLAILKTPIHPPDALQLV